MSVYVTCYIRILGTQLIAIQQIFEQSKFANEAGAAMHLAPNCNGTLRRLGIFAEAFGANDFDAVGYYIQRGTRIGGMRMTLE